MLDGGAVDVGSEDENEDEDRALVEIDNRVVAAAALERSMLVMLGGQGNQCRVLRERRLLVNDKITNSSLPPQSCSNSPSLSALWRRTP